MSFTFLHLIHYLCAFIYIIRYVAATVFYTWRPVQWLGYLFKHDSLFRTASKWFIGHAQHNRHNLF